ncbi:MAG: hypothetical protein ACRDD8_05835 [Bacteroidales bacterium]
MKNRVNKIKYILKHKAAFLRVEKIVRGRITLSGLLHDMDKLFFLCIGLPPSVVSEIHRGISRHHPESIWDTGSLDYTEMIIDWESARLTKPDKPLDANETFWEYYMGSRCHCEILSALRKAESKLNVVRLKYPIMSK